MNIINPRYESRPRCHNISALLQIKPTSWHNSSAKHKHKGKLMKLSSTPSSIRHCKRLLLILDPRILYI